MTFITSLGRLGAIASISPDGRRLAFAARDAAGKDFAVGARDRFATAAVELVPLLTGNTRHFEHVPDLRLLSYKRRQHPARP
ncbi:MAG: hypothetical protein A3H97_24680 [Acidobacteria bacterium RIFCSPLOWO2_02_FULL_65_29]|nr:MAG: hypothetical protein A3H97_24680 [Acidobacteria bacterium RIFCSPLOWO2_02_FULL_65_29]